MKANELMIGDFVCIANSFAKVHDSIDKVIGVEFIDGGYDVFNPEEITPIPLTDDILRNNGFEYFHKNYASISREHPFMLRLDKWPDENGLGGVWTICDIIEIRYVHQLQHALRLCGIDKEIKIKLKED